MPPILPSNILAHYRPATSNEIRAKSFGVLESARFGRPHLDWQLHRGTFDDQRIFGPIRPFRCACGKCAGFASDDILCDLCGVKVTGTKVRRSRCAHINLSEPIQHPLGKIASELIALPVLPVAFVEAPEGERLLRAYDGLLRSSGPAERRAAFEELLSILAPLLVMAHNWNLRQRLLIAHGMALTGRRDIAQRDIAHEPRF